MWADERIKLLGDDVNKQSIEEIETCYFIVCLDDPLPGQHFNSPYNQKKRNVGRHWTNDRDETNMMHQMLHGGGSSFNTGNRWFDKTLQVFIIYYFIIAEKKLQPILCILNKLQFVISSDGVVGELINRRLVQNTNWKINMN